MFGGYDKAASIYWMRPFFRWSLVVWLRSIPLTPALSPRGRGGREPISVLFKNQVQLEISSRCNLNIQPARIPLLRGGKGADLSAFQKLSST
ncbi:hypothetical protein BOW65_15555 [Pseudomonas koreensis]|nr:hypothetical protein BOW65_15555 [Pseudomonas koreensis]